MIRQVEAPIHSIILSLEESPDLDGTSIEALDEFFRQVSLEHKHLALARLKHEARDALAALPSSREYQVLLSGTSVDDTLQESLRGWKAGALSQA